VLTSSSTAGRFYFDVFDKDAIGSDDYMGGFKIPLKSLGTKPVIAWHLLRGDIDLNSPTDEESSGGEEGVCDDPKNAFSAKGKKDKGTKSKAARGGLGKLQLRLFAHLGSGVGLIANDDTEFSTEFSEKFLDSSTCGDAEGTSAPTNKMGGEGDHTTPSEPPPVGSSKNGDPRGGAFCSTLQRQMTDGSGTKGKQRWEKISKSELVLKKLKQLKQFKQVAKDDGSATQAAGNTLSSVREECTNAGAGPRDGNARALPDAQQLSSIGTQITSMMKLMSKQAEELNARIAAIEEKQNQMNSVLTPKYSLKTFFSDPQGQTTSSDRACVVPGPLAGPPIPSTAVA
jgi:hypothetical protein